MSRLASLGALLPKMGKWEKIAAGTGVSLAGLGILQQMASQRSQGMEKDDPMTARTASIGAGLGGLLGGGVGALGFLVPGAGPLVGSITTPLGASIGSQLGGGAGQIASSGFQKITGQNDPYRKQLSQQQALGQMLGRLEEEQAMRMMPLQERRLNHIAELERQQLYQRAGLESLMNQLDVGARGHAGMMQTAAQGIANMNPQLLT